MSCMSNVSSVTDSGAATCSSASLDLDADGGAPIIDTGDGFTIAWVADTTNGMTNDMTTIAETTNP